MTSHDGICTAPASLVAEPGTLRPMLRLALPVLAEQFLATLVVYSDTILAGQYLGQAPLAAMTLLSYFMWLVIGLFAFIAIGSLALVARGVGGGDLDLARRVTHQSLLLGAGFTVALGAGLFVGLGPLVELMHAEADVAPLVTRFLYTVLAALPAVMLTQVAPACLRGAGDTVSGMLAMGLVNVVNVAVGWGLVCPALADARRAVGVPELGFDGLAVGAVAGYLAGGGLMLVMLLAGRAGLRIERQLLRPDMPLIRRILRIGIPGGCDTLSAVVCQMWFVAIIFSLGSTAAAAHGVAVRIESLAYLPGNAFQAAAATLAGQYLGARDPRRASRAVRMTCLVSGTLLSTAGLVFFFGGEGLVRVFVNARDGEVITLAAQLLAIVALAMPSLAVLGVLTGALRGSGDTRWTVAVTTLGLLGVRIPLAYLLIGAAALGVHGAWYAMVADLTFRAALVSARFLHGGWQRVRV